MSFSSLEAIVQLCEPFMCDYRMECITEQSIRDLLEVKEQKVPLQELYVAYDDSGDYDQTAMSIEHVRLVKQWGLAYLLSMKSEKVADHTLLPIRSIKFGVDTFHTSLACSFCGFFAVQCTGRLSQLAAQASG